MKKLIFAMLALAVVGLAACNNTKAEDEAREKAIQDSLRADSIAKAEQAALMEAEAARMAEEAAAQTEVTGTATIGDISKEVTKEAVTAKTVTKKDNPPTIQDVEAKEVETKTAVRKGG